ncbi:MAG: hypothetical protein WKF57_03780 [Nakamurella sp.]
MDPRLAALVASANAEPQVGEMPTVTLPTGPWMVTGIPISDNAFFHFSAHAITQQTVSGLHPKAQRSLAAEGQSGNRLNDMREAATKLVLTTGGTVDSSNVLCLRDVKFNSTAGEISTPVARVPLHSISAWWITPWEHKQARSTGYFVGVDFSF